MTQSDPGDSGAKPGAHGQGPRSNSAPLHRGRDTFTPEQWASVARRFGLTVRDVEVVQSTLDQRYRPGVARELGLSKAAIDKHLQHVFEKVGASDLAELILILVHCALLEPPKRLTKKRRRKEG